MLSKRNLETFAEAEPISPHDHKATAAVQPPSTSHLVLPLVHKRGHMSDPDETLLLEKGRCGGLLVTVILYTLHGYYYWHDITCISVLLLAYRLLLYYCGSQGQIEA